MKKIVIYYSFEGNTDFIARSIAETVDADILKLKPENEIKSKGFMKYVWGGKQVMMKEKIKLNPLDKDPGEYDILFIGTPVWAFSYAPPLASFFSEVNLKGKNIALFCCHGGAKANTFKKMKEKLSENNFIGEIDFVEPLKSNKEQNSEIARNWAKDLTSKFDT